MSQAYKGATLGARAVGLLSAKNGPFAAAGQCPLSGLNLPLGTALEGARPLSDLGCSEVICLDEARSRF